LGPQRRTVCRATQPGSWRLMGGCPGEGPRWRQLRRVARGGFRRWPGGRGSGVRWRRDAGGGRRWWRGRRVVLHAATAAGRAGSSWGVLPVAVAPAVGEVGGEDAVRVRGQGHGWSLVR